jgi:hypothetical protein
MPQLPPAAGFAQNGPDLLGQGCAKPCANSRQERAKTPSATRIKPCLLSSRSLVRIQQGAFRSGPEFSAEKPGTHWLSACQTLPDSARPCQGVRRTFSTTSTGSSAPPCQRSRQGTFCSVVASCGPSARGAAGAAGRYRMPGGGPDFPSRPVPVMDPASCCCSLRGVPFIGQSWPLKWALLCRILRRIGLRMLAPGWLQTGAGGPARRSVQPQRRAGSGWRSELQGLQHRRIGGPATEACEGRGDAEIGAHLLNVLCQ